MLLYVISPSLTYPYCPQCLVRAMEVTYGDCVSRLCIKFEKKKQREKTQKKDRIQGHSGLVVWDLDHLSLLLEAILW